MPRRDGKFFVLKIDPKDFATRFQKVKNNYSDQSRTLMEKSADFAAKVFKESVPVRTGRLRNSIRVMKKTSSRGFADLRYGIEIGTPLNYYRFIDQGTRASPGRYVPFLGKRLIAEQGGFGFHPGIKAQNITTSVQARVERDIGVNLEKTLRSWRDKWNREF